MPDDTNYLGFQIARHGVIVRTGDGKSVHFVNRSELENSEKFGASVKAAKGAAVILAQAGSNIIPKRSNAGWNEEFAVRHGVPLFQTIGAVLRTVRTAAGEIDRDWTAKLKAPASHDATLDGERRAVARSMRAAEVFRLATTNPAFGRAIIAAPELAGIRDRNMLEKITQSVVRANFIEGWPYPLAERKPTASDLLARGTAPEAVEGLANEMMAAFDTRREEIKLAESFVSNALDFAALAGGVSRDVAFQFVMEASE